MVRRVNCYALREGSKQAFRFSPQTRIVALSFQIQKWKQMCFLVHIFCDSKTQPQAQRMMFSADRNQHSSKFILSEMLAMALQTQVI